MQNTFYFLRTECMRYLTVKPKNKDTMFLAFDKGKTAVKCANYVRNHTKTYGDWPSFNMDKESEYISYDMDNMNSKEPIFLVTKTLNDVEDMMQLSNTGVLLCYDFSVENLKNKHTINFRAQEMGLDVHDTDTYISSLNSLIEE